MALESCAISTGSAHKSFPSVRICCCSTSARSSSPTHQRSGPSDYQILMMNYDEVKPFDINLQTQSGQYDKPSTLFTTESKTKSSPKPVMTPNGLLQIPQPKFEVIPKILKGPLHHNVASN